MLPCFSQLVLPIREVARLMHVLPWLALIALGSARAGSTCYDDRDYPAIADLRPTQSGYRIVLSGVFRKSDNSAPVLEYSEQAGWRAAGEVLCSSSPNLCVRETQGCELKLPEIRLSKEAAQRLLGRRAGEISQGITACVEHGEYVYFGIGSYQGEGQDLVGGIGRYNRRTGKMEIRRPLALRNTSVTHLAYDRDILWIGTGGSFECWGMVPTEGLLRYEWYEGEYDRRPDRQYEEAYRESIEGEMCGFMVRGILPRGDTMIVATDMGLAIREAHGRWRHLIPDLKTPGLMRETTCAELYEQLLRTVDREEDCCGWSSFSQLHNALVKFHPSFLEQVVRASVKPEAKRGRPPIPQSPAK